MSEEKKENYWEAVEDIARSILDENGTDEDKWHDAVHEHVDGSSWIIYYGKNEEVLDNTNNEPDNSDVASMAKPDGGWKDLRQTAAYLAMEGDVQEKLRELAPSYEAVTFKLKKTDGTFVTNNEVASARWESACEDAADADEEQPAPEEADDEHAVFDDQADADNTLSEIEGWANLADLQVVGFNEDDEEVTLPD